MVQPGSGEKQAMGKTTWVQISARPRTSRFGCGVCPAFADTGLSRTTSRCLFLGVSIFKGVNTGFRDPIYSQRPLQFPFTVKSPSKGADVLIKCNNMSEETLTSLATSSFCWSAILTPVLGLLLSLGVSGLAVLVTPCRLGQFNARVILLVANRAGPRCLYLCSQRNSD